MIRLFLALACALIVSGCWDDFGDRAMDWVHHQARSYSERLTEKDYKVRWKSYFLYSIKDIDEKHTESTRITDIAYKFLSDQKKINEIEISELVIQSKKNRFVTNQLIHEKGLLELIGSKLAEFEDICSLETYRDLGLYNVPTNSVLSSFHYMAKRAQNQNDMHKGFAIFVKINTDDEGQTEADTSALDEIRMMTVVGDWIYAGINEKKIEKQRGILESAIKMYYETVLNEGEAYKISRAYCEKNIEKHRSLIEKFSGSLPKLEKNWKSLFRTAIVNRVMLDKELRKYKAKQLLEITGLQNEIDRLISEEGIYQVQRSILDLVQERKNLLKAYIKSSTNTQKAKVFDYYLSNLYKTRELCRWLRQQEIQNWTIKLKVIEEQAEKALQALTDQPGGLERE